MNSILGSKNNKKVLQKEFCQKPNLSPYVLNQQTFLKITGVPLVHLHTFQVSEGP